MIPVLGHTTLCQRNDYIFKIELDINGAPFNNLQYTRLVGITFPLDTVVDYMFFGQDCAEYKDSIIEVIEVKKCYIDDVRRTIFIEIVQGYYTNEKMISIITKGLAIRNPCLYNPSNINMFTVNFFSWENITASDETSLDRVFMRMDSRNIIAGVNNYSV